MSMLSNAPVIANVVVHDLETATMLIDGLTRHVSIRKARTGDEVFTVADERERMLERLHGEDGLAWGSPGALAIREAFIAAR